MLMLKLQRRGKKHQASYRLVAGEKRSKLNGRQTDYLGWYNPHQDKFSFNKERILYWLKNGAQMSDTVNNLLIRAGIIEGKKIPK
jgi:small subunit ribosomal protein S16